MQRRHNNVLIRSGEALGVGWSRIMLYSGFNTLHRSVIRRQTGFAARITRTLYGLKMKIESRLVPTLGRISKLVEIPELVIRAVPRYNINPELDGESNTPEAFEYNSERAYEDRLQARIVNATSHRLAGVQYDVAYFDSNGSFLGLNKSRFLDESEIGIDDYLAIDMKVELPESTNNCVFNVRAKQRGAIARMFWGT